MPRSRTVSNQQSYLRITRIICSHQSIPIYPKVIPRIPPKKNKIEEEEEVILIHPSPPLPNDKSTTVSSNDESMILVTENPNNQIIEEINNLITFLKRFKAPNNVVRFLPPTGYCTISRNRENSSRY